MSVGVEYISTIAAGIEDGGNIFDISAFGLTSYLATGTYKFTEDSDFVPYGNIGLGLAIVADPKVTDDNGNLLSGGDSQSGFGANAEVGFAFRNFNLAYAFNLAGQSTSGQTEGDKLGVNYHSFLIGYIYNF